MEKLGKSLKSEEVDKIARGFAREKLNEKIEKIEECKFILTK